MIKHYQAMQTLKSTSEDARVILQVMMRAKKFDLPLFQNESIATMLLGVRAQDAFSPRLVEALKKAFNEMGEVEKKAQFS